MKRHLTALLTVLLPFVACCLPLPATASEGEVVTVPRVEIDRYLGRWYEIGSFPMFFQRNCIADVTADYSPREDGGIVVRNRCRTKDGFIEAEGKATTVADFGNARLKVSFFWPFSSDYWIIGLDDNYRWAVVGNPDRKYLWILSRTPVLSTADLEKAKAAAVAQGYDLSMLRMTVQSGT